MGGINKTLGLMFVRFWYKWSRFITYLINLYNFIIKAIPYQKKLNINGCYATWILLRVFVVVAVVVVVAVAAVVVFVVALVIAIPSRSAPF